MDDRKVEEISVDMFIENMKLKEDREELRRNGIKKLRHKPTNITPKKKKRKKR